MLRVWSIAGEEVTAVRPRDLDVRSLKQHLRGLCGVPRFRQRLLLNGAIVHDDSRLDSPADLQLVVLPRPSLDVPIEQADELANAAMFGLDKKVEEILNHPQDPNTQYSASPLFFAARKGHLEVIRLLLEAEADVNQQFVDGTMALHTAGLRGAIEIVRLLLQAGADKNLTDAAGALPREYAAGYPEVLNLLLDAGEECRH